MILPEVELPAPMLHAVVPPRLEGHRDSGPVGTTIEVPVKGDDGDNG